MTQNLPSTEFRTDPEKDLLTIIFTKSSSKNYKYAVSTAEDADKYEPIDPNGLGELAHQAIYKRNRMSAERAIALLKIVGGWKGTRVFVDGNLISKMWLLTETLRCYIEACQCNNWRAHCYTTEETYSGNETYTGILSINIETAIEDLGRMDEAIGETKKYLIPCKRVSGYIGFKENMGLKMSDIVQAIAVERCCHFCPLFDETKTKEI